MRGFDLVGQRFGRLTVIARTEKPKYHTSTDKWWLCQCDCGNQTVCSTHALRWALTRSCGCYRRERSREHIQEINARRREKKT